MSHLRLIAALLLALLLGGRFGIAEGQVQETEGIPIHVTAVDGDIVYLDLGSDAGVLRGDRVELLPTGASLLVGIVQTVSRKSARASFRDALDGVDAGTEGQVIVPVGRRSTAPAHPPWSAPAELRGEDLPLLAPAHSRAPEERERRIHGRIYGSFDRTDDSQFNQTDQTLGTGMDLEVENPFQHGGQMRFSFDSFLRDSSVSSGRNVSEKRLRVDRASYGVPLRRDNDRGYLMGRFLHTEFAELGILDGVELVQRTDSGSHVGLSAGFLPLTVEDFSTGDDLEASVFYRHASGPEERLVFGGAYQKTWHLGAADRDLVIGKLDLRPTDRTSLRSSLWVDYYTGSDKLKSSGFEVTQAQVSGDWRVSDRSGLGIFASQRRWPDVEMDAYRVSQDTIRNGRLRSLGWYGWANTSKRTRLDGRMSAWKDQDDSGGSASVRFTLRKIYGRRGDASLEVFTTQGSFSDTNGWRLSTWRGLGPGTLRFLWNHSTQVQAGFIGAQANLGRDSIRASYDATLGNRSDLSLYLEQRTGDQQDSVSFGLQLQRRF